MLIGSESTGGFFRGETRTRFFKLATIVCANNDIESVNILKRNSVRVFSFCFISTGPVNFVNLFFRKTRPTTSVTVSTITRMTLLTTTIPSRTTSGKPKKPPNLRSRHRSRRWPSTSGTTTAPVPGWKRAEDNSSISNLLTKVTCAYANS